MKIRVASDLHTEFIKFSSEDVLDSLVPSIKGEEDMVLVLAGDIVADINVWAHSALDIYTKWLMDLAQRHLATIYVGGNHEGYGSNLNTAFEYMRGLSEMFPNFYVLENESIEIAGVKFLGTTKWTPLDGPHDQFYARELNDTKYIGSWNVFKWRQAYEKARYFLESALQKPYNGKVVIVTHHLPSFQSVSESYIGNSFNGCYTSREDDLMMTYKPALWIHGHTHDSCDYEVIDYDQEVCTRVVCNPYGYHGHDLNPAYDPTMVVEV